MAYAITESATATQVSKAKCAKSQLVVNARMGARPTAVVTWVSAGVNQVTKAMTARN